MAELEVHEALYEEVGLWLGAGCKVELSLRYEFSSLLLEKLVGPVFGFIANSMVDAFVKRAQQLYGNR